MQPNYNVEHSKLNFHFDSPTVCVPIAPKVGGGMNSFLLYFNNWMDRNNILHTQDIEADYDILFINSWKSPFLQIYNAKKKKKHIRVIHRIDGSARDYGRTTGDWDARQARANLFADLTIFQSQYSLKSTTEKFKLINIPGEIIYNPINIEQFSPQGEYTSLPDGFRVCIASFSTNSMKGTWQVPEIASANPDLQFILCGNYPNMNILPNMTVLGKLDRDKMASVMRSCNVFLNLSRNDPCPNVVVEALASGLPVLYIDSGGTPELVGEAGLPITLDTFRNQLDIIRSKLEDYRKSARERAISHYAYDVIFPQYWDAITTSQRRPLPTIMDWLKLTLQGYDIWQISPKRIQDKLIRRHANDTN